MIKIKINTTIGYLLLVVAAAIILWVDMSSTIKGVLTAIFMICTAPIFYYYYVMKLVELSHEMKENSPEYYRVNVSTKSYRGVKIIYVPFFEFINDIKKTKNDIGIKLAEELMVLARFGWLSFLLGIAMAVIQIEFL